MAKAGHGYPQVVARAADLMDGRVITLSARRSVERALAAGRSARAVIVTDGGRRAARVTDLERAREWQLGRRRWTDLAWTNVPVLSASADEIATRSSIGLYIFVPPGENERLIAAAGFMLLSADDVTAQAETIAGRWYEARATHRAELTAREGEANFEGLQRFLACVRIVSAERRLSRFCFVAQKT